MYKEDLKDIENVSDENIDNMNREYSVDDLQDYSLEEKTDLLEEISDDSLTDVNIILADNINSLDDCLVEDSMYLEKNDDSYLDDYLMNEIIQDSFFEEEALDVIDIYKDKDQLETIMGDFAQETWGNLAIPEQQERIDDLKNYIVDCIGLENPPEVTYYYNDDPGDYAYVDPNKNIICINEYNLWNNEEAADTIAHELWHSYQQQRADILENETDQMYLEGFQNYISADIDPVGYEEQFVEVDARNFAQQFKDMIKDME